MKVVVSLGHEPVAVPDVTGQTPEQAVANLEELGFEVQKGDDGRSAAVDVGEVMAVTPAPGDGPVEFGSTVTITVSIGVPLVTVPDVSGMKEGEATAALEAVGLKVDATKFFGNKVRNQQPAAGEVVEQGSTVKILVTLVAVIGAHIQIKGGLAKGGLAYTDAVSRRRRAGLRRQSARLEADRRRPERRTRCSPPAASSAASRRSSTRRSWSTSAPPPRRPSSSRSPRSPTTWPAAPGSGCQGVVVHAGSAVGEDRYEAALRQLHERLLPVLDALPDSAPRLLIEPTAGGGKSLAATVEDLGPYLAALEDHPLVGVCFDTCHAWAAGHDLSVPGGMTATLDALEADRRAPAGSGWCTPTTPSTSAAPSGTGTRRSARARSGSRRSPSCWPTRRWPASRWWWRRRASSTARRRPATRATSRCCARCVRGPRRGRLTGHRSAELTAIGSLHAAR